MSSPQPTRLFQPLPLLGNPHVQTVLGAFLPGRTCPAPLTQHVIRLPDGDAVVLYDNTPDAWQPGQPIALLLHGLTGSHTSIHIRRLAALLLARQIRVFRIDMRGTGASLPLSRRTYHAGRTEDIRASLAWLHQVSPLSPLLLIGLSFGGAMTLKLAGEMTEHPVANLVRAAAINPPIDLQRCADLITQPRNRIYERRFVRDLLRNARLRQHHFPELPQPNFPRQLSIVQFDDLYTAPVNGFASAADYYHRSSSAPFIPQITLPTLILTARDDPFIAVEPFDELSVPNNVHLHILDRGGHAGYVGWDGSGGIRWAERFVVDWSLHEPLGQSKTTIL